MFTRRTFMAFVLKGLSVLSLSVGAFSLGVSRIWANAKKTVIPQGTRREELIDKNPADLDTSHLEVAPLADFGTMGLDDYKADLGKWRLVVDGKVENPLSLKYSEILDVPSIEKTVLLVCPGIFANNGTWNGVYIRELLKRAQVKNDAAYVTVKGPQGNYEKVERFPLKEAQSDKMFLAYQVNGVKLPVKHGFPLRLVAEGRYGTQWVKYVWNVHID